MPLVKRNIQPRLLGHGAVPEGIGNELECVTNNTLSAIIRQLSSLSKHAENVFEELFNEANTFYVRANSLQNRIDRLAVKVTQLDSSVEEVSLQDINMRKAFKSSTVQDQQVLSKGSVPHSVADMYNSSDRPPPLSALTAFREDSIDAMKFYSDPLYFFVLWKEKMLQDTEEKRKERRRQREQKRCVGCSTLQREVKKVRKARNRRQEWNMMSLDKELRPDHRHPQTLRRGASSESSLSPDARPDLLNFPVPPLPVHPTYNYAKSCDYLPSPPAEHEYHSIDVTYKRVTYATAESRDAGRVSGSAHPPTDHNCAPPPPASAPPIPSAQTAFGFPLPPASHNGVTHVGQGYMLPPVSPPGPCMIPPPPGPPGPPGPPPPPLPPPAAPSHLPGHSKPVRDARSDLLSAIRMGIQLKKVQEQQNKREPLVNDVATILSRRIAVDYSDSDEDSELDDNEWSD